MIYKLQKLHFPGVVAIGTFPILREDTVETSNKQMNRDTILQIRKSPLKIMLPWAVCRVIVVLVSITCALLHP